MENYEHIKLTASEIATIWTSYQSDTMAICGLKYFLQHVEDKEIQPLLEETLTIMEKHVIQLTDFFKKENYPVPQGFTDQDCNLNAPRLFSDKLYLEYILNMTDISLASYATYLVASERKDIIDYYTACLTTVQELHVKSKELSKEKGIYIRAPHIPIPKQIDFVKKQSFLEGWFTDRRPLLGVEIASLVFNARRNALGQALITGFSQVAQLEEIRRYFEKGRDIAGKQFEAFRTVLHKNYLSEGAELMTSEVSDSTVSPFSDKLMMSLVNTLISSGIGQYGMSMSTSPRHDIGVLYTRLMAEIAKYANEGAKITIDNGWMEQPPMAADRKDLAN